MKKHFFMKKTKILLAFLVASVAFSCQQETQKSPAVPSPNSWAALKKQAQNTGKPEWREMLLYVANLHEKSTHEPVWPFDHEWEEIGPGYVYGPAFGHWDIVHQSLDVLPAYPEHALKQMLNNVKNQEPHGLLPGSFWMPGAEWATATDSASWSSHQQGHPPFWVVAVDHYIGQTGNDSVLNHFYTPLVRQIAWFENSRKAENEGFFYNDILSKRWESGVDEGVRFDETQYGKWACIDATSHVYLLYKTAARWAEKLSFDARLFRQREKELQKFIQNKLYDQQSGLFYDIWAMRDSSLRTLAFETFFPLVVGAATNEQANRLIDEYLLDTAYFNTPHPIATVAQCAPKFELRMWRGPAWNSMTYWVAQGCINYGRNDAAKILLEKALDQSARQFERTGTIWEFYHPLGGKPEDLQRKPHTEKNEPCREYLGHNPLIEMARLYDQVKQ